MSAAWIPKIRSESCFESSIQTNFAFSRASPTPPRETGEARAFEQSELNRLFGKKCTPSSGPAVKAGRFSFGLVFVFFFFFWNVSVMLFSFVLFTAPKSGSGAVNPNLPPLRFHNVHGENVRLYKNGFVARRVDSFCKGVAFSSRPVAVNEKVYIKFLEISDNWSGVLRFGFTNEDPLNIKKVPKYACPGKPSTFYSTRNPSPPSKAYGFYCISV